MSNRMIAIVEKLNERAIAVTRKNRPRQKGGPREHHPD